MDFRPIEMILPDDKIRQWLELSSEEGVFGFRSLH